MPARVQRRRDKGWRNPEGAVYVGRGSRWGNPFILYVGPSREDVVRLYRDLIEHGEVWCGDGDRWIAHPDQREWLTPEAIRRELAGRDLMCWCSLDQPCHADVLLEIANSDD